MKASYRVYKSIINRNWVTEYLIDGYVDTDVRGTSGLGAKLFPTKEKAEASGKRYVKKMVSLGFEK